MCHTLEPVWPSQPPASARLSYAPTSHIPYPTHAQASPAVSVPGGGAGGQSPDDHRYVDMMSLQLPSSLELGSSLRGALPSDLDLNAADQQVQADAPPLARMSASAPLHPVHRNYHEAVCTLALPQDG